MLACRLQVELAKHREEATQAFVLRRRAPASDRCVVQDVALLGMSSLVDVFVNSGVDPEPVLQDLKYLVGSFPPAGVSVSCGPPPLPSGVHVGRLRLCVPVCVCVCVCVHAWVL